MVGDGHRNNEEAWPAPEYSSMSQAAAGHFSMRTRMGSPWFYGVTLQNRSGLKSGTRVKMTTAQQKSSWKEDTTLWVVHLLFMPCVLKLHNSLLCWVCIFHMLGRWWVISVWNGFLSVLGNFLELLHWINFSNYFFPTIFSMIYSWDFFCSDVGPPGLFSFF